ncbi:MAG: dockerin type I repeat-containing protein, partial [Oscillospiraceae bacterium]|nr:dockerin type I repeat-containing protein [Oscillospiraceae bacterium]
TLDADAVLAKWKEMLLAEGYPEKTLANFTCEITENGGGYQVRTTQDGYKTLTLADCLKTFPDVQRIEMQYGYRSDDFANSAGSFRISFQYVSEIELSAEDFPALDISDISYHTYDTANPNGKWYLTLNSTQYTDYFAAVQYLLKLEDVYDLCLDYVITCMAMENEPLLTESGPAVLYERGDLNLDGTSDVSDAVLLARYLAADAEAVISDQGLANADADGNSQVQTDDLVVILKRIAKQY